jgi:MarR family transcriptional regulator, organic hydroperoxide resistance regulator
MKKGNLISIIAKINKLSHQFIVSHLEQKGIKGIVPSHGDILFLLFHNDALSMQDLATKIHRTKPTVTVLVDKLIELGYVKKVKCDKDGRVSYISLSQRGIELKPSLDEISDRLNELVYAGLSDAQAEKLEIQLEFIRANFEKS